MQGGGTATVKFDNDCGCINIDEGVPVIGMGVAVLLVIIEKGLTYQEIAKIPLGEESMRRDVVRSWRLMGRKQLTRLMILMFYFNFMYGVESRVPSNVNPNLSAGVEAKLWQVPETLPEEALSKMSTPPKSESPIITPDELTEADGFVFGFPTRYGMMAAQFKVFLDTTGGLRRTQSLAGKPAGSSTALALKVVAKKRLRKFP
ncbi:hypothetical protein F2Q69_00044813 [Brassica cretica]|uniref:NAD(P)H dehydrogenase (quinone) n=1 Tax=Brassica cretica TaxID=69181 RepID=A0A8S9NRW3_BRACR|nr:hypothetical protein F2Q69_00044813 [Brassica cretica]